MATRRRQLRKLGDRLAGKDSWDSGAFSRVLSTHTHAHRIYAWCERRKGTMMAKQERRHSWSRRDTGGRGEVSKGSDGQRGPEVRGSLAGIKADT